MTDNISLVSLTPEDKEQFILDNQRAFKWNRLGFHIVEFWNKYQHGPDVPENIEENWSEDDEMFLFRKCMDSTKK